MHAVPGTPPLAAEQGIGRRRRAHRAVGDVASGPRHARPARHRYRDTK